MFTVAGFFIPFKTCDVVDALPHASWVDVVELFFTLFLYCRLAALMDLLRS